MSTVTFLPLFFGTVLESANSKKNAGDELTSSLTRQIDTQKNRPRANSRRTDDARIRARIRKKNSVSPRVFFVVVVGRALREKSRLGERIVIDRFFVYVFTRIALFEPKKKSVTNTFRGTNSVRKRARAGLHRTSRVFRVEITRGFIERTRRRAGASFARRSKAEGNARVFARRDESNRRKKSSLFRCVGIFF